MYSYSLANIYLMCKFKDMKELIEVAFKQVNDDK